VRAHVLTYALTRLRALCLVRYAVALLGLLERVDRASLAAQRRVTVPFLRGLLDAG